VAGSGVVLTAVPHVPGTEVLKPEPLWLNPLSEAWPPKGALLVSMEVLPAEAKKSQVAMAPEESVVNSKGLGVELRFVRVLTLNGE